MIDHAAASRRPRCWKIQCWPKADQSAWTAGQAPTDPFDDMVYGNQLCAETLEKVRKGYGRWLDFLDATGWLDPDQPALARITRGRLISYLRALKAAGNADNTIIGRVIELEMAMKIMAPGADVSWIRRPTGVTVYASLPKARRQLIVPDSGVLFAWSITMMDTADLAGGALDALLAYRDGLIIAVFASRARRLRAMAGIRVGKELVRRGDRYWVELGPELVKTKKADRFQLPDRLTPYIERYLAVVRPALLQGRASDALWISLRRKQLTAKGMEAQFFQRTKARFGVGFGPHRCRHAAATTAILRAPDATGLAARMMGTSLQVIENHYQRAGQVEAINHLDDLINRRMKALHDPQ
jgi:hypothetical protein